MIFNLHSEGFRVTHAIGAINLHSKFSPETKDILHQILFIRQSEELYLSSTVPKVEIIIGGEIIQRTPTDSATEPKPTQKFTGVSKPSVSGRRNVKGSHFILLGINKEGNLFRKASKSINYANLKMSALEESFMQEVFRAEQRESHLLHTHIESENED